MTREEADAWASRIIKDSDKAFNADTGRKETPPLEYRISQALMEAHGVGMLRATDAIFDGKERIRLAVIFPGKGMHAVEGYVLEDLFQGIREWAEDV